MKTEQNIATEWMTQTVVLKGWSLLNFLVIVSYCIWYIKPRYTLLAKRKVAIQNDLVHTEIRLGVRARE